MNFSSKLCSRGIYLQEVFRLGSLAFSQFWTIVTLITTSSNKVGEWEKNPFWPKAPATWPQFNWATERKGGKFDTSAACGSKNSMASSQHSFCKSSTICKKEKDCTWAHKTFSQSENIDFNSPIQKMVWWQCFVTNRGLSCIGAPLYGTKFYYVQHKCINNFI